MNTKYSYFCTNLKNGTVLVKNRIMRYKYIRKVKVEAVLFPN